MNHINKTGKKPVYAALLLLVNILLSANLYGFKQKIDLSGKWEIRLDSTKKDDFKETIQLPGTTDEAGLGNPDLLSPELKKPQLLHLTRKHSYVGVAWYKKTVNIPSDWKNKQITLKLERVIWQSSVWVDGVAVAGVQESLSTPHFFNLSQQLTPGQHTLVVRIDNRKKYDISVNNMAHAYTNETQIMWNGILGEISLTAENKTNISTIQVFPDTDKKQIRLRVYLQHPFHSGINGRAEISVRSISQNQSLQPLSLPIHVSKSDSMVEMIYPMGKHILLWNELHPDLYELSVLVKGRNFSSSGNVTFGMRNLSTKNARIQVNGENVFLRGTLECCIFPLTGHPPMGKKGWEKEFKTAKEWGLNHLRFHSWCPPEAAFEVADSMGFYLQIELPLWSLTVNKDKKTDDFLYAEADKIIRAYGNHPSFCFWSIGNELQPDFNFLNAFVDRLKQKDPRHLYTNTSYTFEKGHGDWPERNDDYFITQKTKKGWVRGQGVFENTAPSFDKNYDASVEGMSVPLITHEIGQYAVYPDINEISKYTGVLDPLNFKAIKADLIKKGLMDKARDYLFASGKLAALLYKEEVERAMKTNGISGFQLLGLQDFPGQGTALVGLVNAFWESKGLITSSGFKSFCGPVVPLASFGSPVFTNQQTFSANISVANYSSDTLSGNKIIWELTDTAGTLIKSGNVNTANLPTGENTSVGEVNIPLNFVRQASQLNFIVKINGTKYENQWKIWIYPSDLNIEFGSVVYTRDFDEANKALEAGKNVLYNPDWRKLKGIEGKFLPVFWSPVHFPKQAATMGLLCNPGHPVFRNFPTAMHTDWQWWSLLTNSKTLIIDSLTVTPLVEMIDNFVNNRRLSNLFEAKSGKGKLIYTTIDLSLLNNNRPEAKQLLFSLLKYMNSTEFKPSTEISFPALRKFGLGEIDNHKSQPTDIY